MIRALRQGRSALTSGSMPGTTIQVPPNCDLTMGLVCTDKSTPGSTTWRAISDERFCNPAGILQGGFLGAICDSAMGASALTYVQGRKVFARNAEMKISFLAPVVPGRVLECVARVISGGSTTAFVEAELSDVGPVGQAGQAGQGINRPAQEDRRLVAKASSTYMYADREA
jgi:acyl-coenzyme A thioesterase PaaI-like protein